MTTRPFHSSPPKLSPRGYVPHSTDPTPLVKARQKRLLEGMSGCFLGPMDPTEFMRSLMPINSSGIGHFSDEIDFSLVYNQRNERSMYDPFVRQFLTKQ